MNISLSLLTMDDANALFLFEKENKDFFKRFVPPRPDSYFEFEPFLSILEELVDEQENKKSFFFLIKNDNGEIIGRMNLVDVDWESKTVEVGYRIGEQYGGRGAAARGLKLVIAEARRLSLQELQAKTTISNIPSQKVLEKCLFDKVYTDQDGFVHYRLTL